MFENSLQMMSIASTDNSGPFNLNFSDYLCLQLMPFPLKWFDEFIYPKFNWQKKSQVYESSFSEIHVFIFTHWHSKKDDF